MKTVRKSRAFFLPHYDRQLAQMYAQVWAPKTIFRASDAIMKTNPILSSLHTGTVLKGIVVLKSPMVALLMGLSPGVVWSTTCPYATNFTYETSLHSCFQYIWGYACIKLRLNFTAKIWFGCFTQSINHLLDSMTLGKCIDFIDLIW